MNQPKNMLLYTSFWGDKDTFKLLPLTNDCPYAEVIYDPSTTLLVVISKIKKQNYQFIPKLDDDGDSIRRKKPAGPNSKPYREQRALMEVLQEYYISDKDEQKDFISQIASNADAFDFEKYLRDLDEEPTIMQPETSGLVDKSGKPMSKK